MSDIVSLQTVCMYVSGLMSYQTIYIIQFGLHIHGLKTCFSLHMLCILLLWGLSSVICFGLMQFLLWQRWLTCTANIVCLVCCMHLSQSTGFTLLVTKAALLWAPIVVAPKKNSSMMLSLQQGSSPKEPGSHVHIKYNFFSVLFVDGLVAFTQQGS